MPTLILARHGRTTANASGVLAGRSKGIHLDDIGLDQATRAAARLADVQISAAVTSPLERCRETAKLLLADVGVSATVDRGLNECDYGDWTGQKLSVLARRSLWKTVQSSPSAAAFPNGESLAAMSARAIAAVRRRDAIVAADHGPGAVWLAVSHGDIIKAILADALGMHLDSFQRLMAFPASLSVVQYAGDRTFVHCINTTAGALAISSGKPTRKPRHDAVVGGAVGPTS